MRALGFVAMAVGSTALWFVPAGYPTLVGALGFIVVLGLALTR